MSETINKGWIKSPDEIKFAPKTFAEQVIVNGETTLDMELEKYETIKNNCPTLDAEDAEGTCTAGDYVSRIQELEAKNLELTNELAELNSKIFDTDWHSGSCALTLEKGKIMSITLTDGNTYTFVRYSSGEITWIPIFVNSITACTISTNDSDGTIIITNTNGDNVRAVGIRY